ncbi:cytochrome P450 [Pseudonocardiaceae bacterium YIM PH 21723]|nr:cytochrome P450 [Pseudonocardiaceae bacterium YIM PH 21723]
MTANLPAGPRAPRPLQGAYMLFSPHRGVHAMRERYGRAYTVNVPFFGHAVVISERDHIKQLFAGGPDKVDNLEPNLGRILGRHSLFAMPTREHDPQRKLLIPPFHGKRLGVYESIIEEETLREIATWPTGTPFATAPSTMRITLNAILRAVFGADGEEFDELREILPEMTELGSRLAILPIPQTVWPWTRHERLRQRYCRVVDRLIDKATDLDGRNDILAMMLQSRYEDGSSVSREFIYDQLITLLAAGHETTANTLAWTVERLRRHPEILKSLVDEADADGKELREATILEVQRHRSVIDFVGRRVVADEFELGPWVIPKGHSVMVSIELIHTDPEVFPEPDRFDPYRFVGRKADLYTWIPYGGGNRRCLGAAFAQMEMNVVLRTLLREVTLLPTTEPDEKVHFRGIAYAPKDGALAQIRPRVAVPA